jgi:hypothetical protein
MDISPYADTREGALEEALHSEACAMDGEEGNEHCICRAPRARILVLSPGLVEAKIPVVFCLACNRVPVGKEQLEAGRFEVVIAARIDER